jgi:hypothetical protein
MGGWRGLAVPLETPPAIVDRLCRELEVIVTQPPIPGSFAEFVRSQKFDGTWRGPKEFATFIAENDSKLGALLQQDAMRTISRDKFSPMTAPYILMGLLCATLVGMYFDARRPPRLTHTLAVAMDTASNRVGRWNFAWIIASIVLFILLAETVGFLLVTSTILTCLMIRMGNHWLTSLMVSCGFVLVLYLVFAYCLRVPLPRGWLG